LNTQKQILLIVVLFFTLVGGCAAYSIIDLPYRAPSQVDWTHDQSVERGALLFANNCRTCHGITGQGGVGLQLNKQAFKDQDPLVLAATKQLLLTTLNCGRMGTRMPAWLSTNGGSLNARQIDHLVDLITSPADPGLKGPDGQPFLDSDGNPSSKGWLEAEEFAHNLNRETSAVVGGDNLDGIAKSHLIGYQQLADANNVPVQGILKQGSVLHIPGFREMPNGFDYHVYKDNETITKVADSQHVGAVMIADLNNLSYNFTQNKENATFTLTDDKGNDVPGLFPGTVLKLPSTAVYVVASGDTLDDVAQKHGLSASDIRGLNTDVLAAQSYTDSSKPMESENRLKLPNGTGVIVQPAQTLGTIATAHGIDVKTLADANGIEATATVKPGDKLKLPDNSRYIIAIGDTLASVAAAHGITADALASAQTPKATDPLSQSVVLKLPQVDKFTTAAQSLEDVAKGYSNVTAESLGTANNIPANAQLRVGQKLALPADSWGSAPPDTLNTGTACVQHAVPDNVYQQLLPGAATPAVATPPANVSNSVSVDANANDFTVIADGKPQTANEGVVLVAKGAAIVFTNKVGLHTIDDNGKNTGTGIDFKVGDTRTLTFTESGDHKITCEVHPAMLAHIFVQ
jgi:LysM repeat protein/mono/diheme cytochrome c family protein